MRVVRPRLFLDKAPTTDLKLALAQAVTLYQAPLGAITQYSNPWGAASSTWTSAGQFVEFAKSVAAETAPLGNPGELKIAVGEAKAGRFGLGDRVVPKSLDDNLADSFADVYVLEIKSGGKYVVSLVAAPCQ